MAADFLLSLSGGAKFGHSRWDDPAFLGWFSTIFLTIVVEIMTLGLPQVCKLWFGVRNGILPVKHITPKILKAVNYCGRQLSRRLGWAAPANHKKEGAARNLQCVGIACCMIGDLMGALGCGLGRGILVVCVEGQEKFVKKCGDLEKKMELVVSELW